METIFFIIRRLTVHKLIIFYVCIFQYSCLYGQELSVKKINENYQISLNYANKVLLSSPDEGLWSIALGWKNKWPSDWKHVKPTHLESVGEWKILSGSLKLSQGEWIFKDFYKYDLGKIKCIRRFEWKGKTELDSITLAVRWTIPSRITKPFLPGILYYGNPSGEINGKNNVPWYHNQPGEEALFEEHRFPMPFVSLEWKEGDSYFGAALHTKPSPVYMGNLPDQWWSMGLLTNEYNTEIRLLSGPVAYNQKKNTVKALQSDNLPYEWAFIKVLPGTVIEKTFYLDAFQIEKEGSGFQRPIYTSIDIFKPFYTDDFPKYSEIIKAKYRFTNSRWIANKDYAGYNMYPSFLKPQIVLGWAGQSEAPAYALQVLSEDVKDVDIWNKIQLSMDHICSSPFDENGFNVVYDINSKEWSSKDLISQGQAINTIVNTIVEAKNHPQLNSQIWKEFLKKSCDIFAKRILRSDWKPKNTSEAFFIAPLFKASKLFDSSDYKNAALKATKYYIKRHITMKEPYWGGTLDATCEDKEGAWGAFQAFLAAYEYTKDLQFLVYAKHACDVTLSYTVVWDIPMPAGRLADHNFKSRGWTSVSVQNQHLDVYGVLIAPSVYKMGQYMKNESLKRLARTMFLSCGQLIDPYGSQGEQLQETNFAQQGNMSNVFNLRGGYSEQWTVYWITAHFLTAAAEFKKIGVQF